MRNEIQKALSLLKYAWNKRWWLLGVHVLSASVALSAFYLSPARYKSTTTIRVSPDSVINPLTQGLAVSSSMENLASTLRQEVLSRKHLEDVIARLDLEPPDTDPVLHQQLLEEMTRSISIHTRGRSGGNQSMIFQITYQGLDPYQVRDVANALAGLFIEKNLEIPIKAIMRRPEGRSAVLFQTYPPARVSTDPNLNHVAWVLYIEP